MTTKKIKKIILLLVAILIGIFALVNIWLLTGKLNTTKAKILKIIPYPLTLVNNSPITAENYLARGVLAKNIPNKTVSETNLNILNRLIYEEKVRQLAKKNSIGISDKELKREWDRYLGATKGNSIKNIGQNKFKNQVFKFNLLSEKLKIWFNSQKELNPKAYETAEFLQKKLKQGSSFTELSKMYNQDKSSKLTEGDLGFVKFTKLLPEIQEQLDFKKNGTIELVPSRFGLHLLKIVGSDNLAEDGSLRLHLNQIFINTNNFENWVKAETQNYKVRQIIKI